MVGCSRMINTFRYSSGRKGRLQRLSLVEKFIVAESVQLNCLWSGWHKFHQKCGDFVLIQRPNLVFRISSNNEISEFYKCLLISEPYLLADLNYRCSSTTWTSSGSNTLPSNQRCLRRHRAAIHCKSHMCRQWTDREG